MKEKKLDNRGTIENRFCYSVAEIDKGIYQIAVWDIGSKEYRIEENAQSMSLRFVKLKFKSGNKKFRDRHILEQINKVKELLKEDYIEYITKIAGGQPYLGNILVSLQCKSVKRIAAMKDTIKKELKKAEPSYRILEIGSWAGQSTMIWGLACKERGRGKVFCIDTWEGAGNVAWMQNKKRMIYNLFQHNIGASGLEDYVVAMNGTSDDFAGILKPNSFDFIYIDGDHAYKQFKRDLVNYKEFVRVGGILCGDDLELYLKDIDLAYTKKYCEKDFVDEPNTGKGYHPGIALGVYEVFGDSISMKEGFWAVRKAKGGWEKVEL